MAFLLEGKEQDIIDIRANGSLSPFYLSYFWVMEPSSPFLKILPYEVARGWVGVKSRLLNNEENQTL